MICAIIGDSIAIDAGRHIPQCIHDAKIGIGSAAIIGRVHDADLVVISAGSNDPHNPRLAANLRTIRAKITGHVLWILPIDRTAALAVREVAAIRGDLIVTFEPAGDRVHPKTYTGIDAAIRAALVDG